MITDKYLFLIRAYNESTRIIAVIENIFHAGYEHILVIDDGSIDGTSDRIREAFADRVYLVRHMINRGGGAAMETGFAWVKHHANDIGVRYVVTFDADGQMDIDDMRQFEKYLDTHPETDIIFGSRFIEKTRSNVPWYRRIVLWGGRIFTSVISGVHLSDAHNGYRLFSIDALHKISLSMDGMEYASELIDQIHALGYTIAEVPVNIHYDSYTLAKGQRMGGAIRVAGRMIYKKFF